MEFEWDEEKDIANQRKHRVCFRDAASVFFDPKLQTRPDLESPVGEPRVQSVGMSPNDVLFVVSIDKSDEVIRIILARRARPAERRLYDKGRFGS